MSRGGLLKLCRSEQVMSPKVGILAYGSLIDNPGAEIEAALISREADILTPFGVEFARSSSKGSGAPTLVPVRDFFVYVDGLPSFTTMAVTNMLSELRKYRC